jgi:hypothetical protein
MRNMSRFRRASDRDLSFLLSPRIRKRLGESRDGEIGWRGGVGDRRNDARRHEGERRQKADVAFAKRCGRETPLPQQLR